MAVRSGSRKTGAKKSTRAAGAKKPATKKAPAAAKKASAAPKETTAPKKVAKQSEAGQEAVEPAAEVRASQVTRGDLFSLRPRVTMAFKTDDFRRAKQLLEDEAFKSLEEAARAVADKAIDLTRDGPPSRY